MTLYLGEDDLDRVVLWRVGRVEYGCDVELSVDRHDLFRFVNLQVVEKEVDWLITLFLSKYPEPAYKLLVVDSLLSHLEMLYFTVGRYGTQSRTIALI